MKVSSKFRRTKRILFFSLLFHLVSATSTPSEDSSKDDVFDVLVYGSTPSGIMAAVAASRHLPASSKIALLSQRAHLGGMCSGGLGQSDVGNCASEVTGGLTLEFFRRNQKHYGHHWPAGVREWNLEPHVARRVLEEMLYEAGVILLPFDQVETVQMNEQQSIEMITVTGGQSYPARAFVDASYEGDLMARVPGITYFVGRESQQQYNESGAGSSGPGRRITWGIEYMDPFDKEGNLLPLLDSEMPKPRGAADNQVQAYNFRICVTNHTSLKVPFQKPDSYQPERWELLRRFWRGWYNSTNRHKQAQASVPTAILGRLPSSNPSVYKFDMNNCGYNPIHTDFMGHSWQYPEADYIRREELWQDHVSYTEEFLWFMSTDLSVPVYVRHEFRHQWGYCGDEFPDTNHFPPQLYVREARRLVGQAVLTQNDVLNKTPLGTRSIGMGCYAFDSHCVSRYACTDPALCNLYDQPYVATEAGTEHMDSPGIYQIPWTVLLPQKSQVTNLLVSVCVSASHVAYSTVRMEPQYMIMGHAAGVVAALALNHSTIPHRSTTDTVVVQDVDVDELNMVLVQDGQLVSLNGATTAANRVGDDGTDLHLESALE